MQPNAKRIGNIRMCMQLVFDFAKSIVKCLSLDDIDSAFVNIVCETAIILSVH